MTVMETVAGSRTSRESRRRHYLMCPPTYFSVTYAINPWMDPDVPVNHELAGIQWDVLRHTYQSLGHTVDLIEPEPDLPDMVFAANGGLVVGGRAYSAKFRYEQRQAESRAYRNWLERAEITAVEPIETNEGEGDFLTLANMIFAGSGFRTSIAAHVEAADAIDRPVVSSSSIRVSTISTPASLCSTTATVRRLPRSPTTRPRSAGTAGALFATCFPTPSSAASTTLSSSASTRSATATTSYCRQRQSGSASS